MEKKSCWIVWQLIFGGDEQLRVFYKKEDASRVIAKEFDATLEKLKAGGYSPRVDCDEPEHKEIVVVGTDISYCWSIVESTIQ